MDPNETLEAFRALMLEASQAPEESLDKAAALIGAAYLAESLDEWISDGGFLPLTWTASATGRSPS